MTPPTPLNRLAEAYDIEPGYTDIWQRHHVIGAETKRALLEAMGVPASSDAEIRASLAAIDEKMAACAMPGGVVEREGEPIMLPAPADIGEHAKLSWTIVTEEGERHEGQVITDDLPVIEETEGDVRPRKMLSLLADLPLGYHRCSVVVDDEIIGETSIIVTPKRAYWSDDLNREGGLVGVTAPLYGLRSGRNAGLGDFADLAELAGTLAPLGAAFIGINPVHALFPRQPARISPYSPSSRMFLNVLMIALDQVPEVAGSNDARAILAEPVGEALLQKLRAADLVDYPKVAAFKFRVLEAAFETFLALPESASRRSDFRRFVEAGGERLRRHARFEALSEHLLAEDATLADWHDWPAAYQAPESDAVQAFATAHDHRVTFFAYLQWLAQDQLGKAQASAKKTGMALGLYLDLAVGVAPDGAEAWSDQGLLVDDVRIGAPPDDFNPDGQNWGLLPLSPSALRARGYRPFIDMLESSMRHADALRIDHVLGLARSFWLPTDPDIPGAYVRYPMRDLLGLVALSSHRQRCVVIGEDLGTVPRFFRSALDEQGLLGCRILYFEREEEGSYRPSSAYPQSCIASIGTHDLPTLKGFWQGRDIDWRERLGLYADTAHAHRDRSERQRTKKQLLYLLEKENLLPDGIDPDRPPATMPRTLVDAFHRFLGRTPAALKVVQLEDLVGADEQAQPARHHRRLSELAAQDRPAGGRHSVEQRAFETSGSGSKSVAQRLTGQIVSDMLEDQTMPHCS